LKELKGLILSAGEIKERVKELHRRKDELLEELKDLEKKRKSGEISEEEYKERRHTIERGLVEIMDRLAQMRFIISGM